MSKVEESSSVSASLAMGDEEDEATATDTVSSSLHPPPSDVYDDDDEEDEEEGSKVMFKINFGHRASKPVSYLKLWFVFLTTQLFKKVSHQSRKL